MGEGEPARTPAKFSIFLRRKVLREEHYDEGEAKELFPSSSGKKGGNLDDQVHGSTAECVTHVRVRPPSNQGARSGIQGERTFSKGCDRTKRGHEEECASALIVRPFLAPTHRSTESHTPHTFFDP